MNEMAKCGNSTDRTARKKHKCMGCGAEIKIGDKYRYTSGIWDEPKSFKHCQSCAKVLDNFTLMDKDLDHENGPCLEWGGVKEFFYGFVWSDWCGRKAAKEVSEMFSVPMDYALNIFGDDANQD